MKKEITLGQLLSVGASILIAVITGWVTLNNKVSSHESEIKSLQNDNSRIIKWMEKFDDKMDKNSGKIEEILIELQNKKNRD